jgi:predicted esterase
MADALRLAGYREPLGLQLRAGAPPAAYPELRVQRFEVSSRGDRVLGRLMLPERGSRPFPLIVLQHGFGGACDADYIDATAAPWVADGAAVVAIDLPLHGARADRKLAERVREAFGDPMGPMSQLAVEFARQSVIDLERTFDAIASLDVIDPDRCAFAGFSMGAMLGAAWCALDPRPRAVALAVAGGRMLPAGIDPTEYVSRIAPRPLLLVNASRDETIPRAATEALFEAAGHPKEQRWFDAGHSDLPGGALKAMWEFLADPLEIAAR